MHAADPVRDRVLVVDDDPDLRRAYLRHLRAAGFDVRCAAGLREATGLIALRKFEAVIIDVCLREPPDGADAGRGAEGLALARQARRLGGRQPVLVVTAYGVPEHAASAARLGVDVFLHKPVSLAWLGELLRTCIERRRTQPARVLADTD